jgi:hypothetical protein
LRVAHALSGQSISTPTTSTSDYSAR